MLATDALDRAPTGLSAHRMARFVRDRTLLVLALPLLLWIGVAVHELLHAAAVLALGGDVIDVRTLPSVSDTGVTLGATIYRGVDHPALVSIAPTVGWLLVAVAALAALPRVRHRGLAGALLAALVVAPMVDISAGFAGGLLGVRGADLAALFSSAPWLASLLCAITLPGLGALAWMRFRALSPTALSQLEFGVGLGALLVAPWIAFVAIS